MKELTKAEEQVMHILWDKKNAFVKEIVSEFPKPKPAYNTVSTIIRILETKGVVAHEAFGKSHRYYPLINKEKYLNFSMNRMVQGYFSGSASNLMSFFIKDKNLDATELDELLQIIENAKKNKS